MKRKVSILLALVLAISLAACGKAPADGNASSNGDASSAAETVSEAAEQTAGSEPSEGGGNVLIAYFSWADNAVLADDVDAIASPSVLVPGNVQQLAGWVQEKREEICSPSVLRIPIPATGTTVWRGPTRSAGTMPARSWRSMWKTWKATMWCSWGTLKWSRVISVYSGVLRRGRRANRYRKHSRKKKVCIE